MTRSAVILIWVMVLLALAAAVAGVATRMTVAYRRAEAADSHRAQAREWALGAIMLQPGAAISVDEWKIQHQPPGRVSAVDGAGRGWWIQFENINQSKRVVAEGPVLP